MPTLSSPAPHPPTLLTIAGHDPSSGAGITADLQTFAAHRFFGTSAITALTVQSTLGVAAIEPVLPTLLDDTLRHVAADLPPAGIKIGMLGSSAIVSTIAAFLQQRLQQQGFQQQGFQQQGIERPLTASSPSEPSLAPPIVLDPVLRSSSGADLLPPGALDILHNQLLPTVTWITPNWPELAALTGLPVATQSEAEAAMHALAARHPHLHIVATGGDQAKPIDLLRLPSGELHRFTGEHIATTSTHGTGCAFSSALLCHLVLGDTPIEAVHAAKLYVTEALRRAPHLGHGKGPLNLLWPLG